MEWFHILALALPMVAMLFAIASRRLVYQGPVNLLTSTVVFGRSERLAFVAVVVPGVGEFLADLPVATARAIPQMEQPIRAEATVRRSLIGRMWVDGLVINGQVQDLYLTGAGPGMFTAAAYLIMGMFGLTLPSPLFSELAFICAGYVAGNRLTPRLDRSAGSILSLGIMTLLLLLGTVVLFAQTSILMLFPGMAVAFGFGQLAGMLIRALRKE